MDKVYIVQGEFSLISEQEIELFRVVPSHLEMTTQISKEFPLGAKEALISCLRMNLDIFPWSPKDLTSVDLEVMEHHFHISANACFVK